MSTCISRHGEYSDHQLGDWCPRCGAFNEAAIVAERDRLRAAVRQAREVIDDITITDPGLVVVRVGKILDTLAGDDGGEAS